MSGHSLVDGRFFLNCGDELKGRWMDHGSWVRGSASNDVWLAVPLTDSMPGIACCWTQLLVRRKTSKLTSRAMPWLIGNRSTCNRLRLDAMSCLNWVDQHALKRVTVHLLTDAHGPAPRHPTADAIVATPETRGECDRINALRRGKRAASSPHHRGHAFVGRRRTVISSSRIRNGLVDVEGHPLVLTGLGGRVVAHASAG